MQHVRLSPYLNYKSERKVLKSVCFSVYMVLCFRVYRLRWYIVLIVCRLKGSERELASHAHDDPRPEWLRD